MKKGDIVDLIIVTAMVILVIFIGVKYMFPSEPSPVAIVQTPKEPVKVNTFAEDLKAAQAETDKHTEILTTMQAQIENLIKRIDSLEKYDYSINNRVTKTEESLRVRLASIHEIKTSLGVMNNHINRIHEREDNVKSMTVRIEGTVPIEIKSLPPKPEVLTPEQLKKKNGIKNSGLFK